MKSKYSPLSCAVCLTCLTQTLPAIRHASYAISAATVPQRVRIAWVRHGFSCGNVVRKLSGKGLRHLRASIGEGYFLQDPPLADIGVNDLRSARDEIDRALGRTPNFVGASVSLRAQETAIAVSQPRVKVEVLPYISERSPKWVPGRKSKGVAENVPSSVEEQRSWHVAHDHGSNVVYDRVENISRYLQPDMDQALAYIATHVVPRLGSNGTEELQLLIVSHSKFLSEEFTSRCNKPDLFTLDNMLNGMVVQVDYQYDVVGKTLVQAKQHCEIVFPGFSIPSCVRDSDIDRCGKRYTKYVKRKNKCD